ncbi:MAG: glycosyltransferase [Acidimicrobiales bacterium]
MITRLNVGGPARQALLLARGLAPEYETLVAAGRPTEVEGELGDPAVPVHRVPLVRAPDPVADARALSAVRGLLVTHRPALLHTHMAKAGAVGRLAALSVRRRPRVVHTFHGHVLEGYFGPRGQRAAIETERALARAADALVAVSPEIRDELLALGVGRPVQFHVIGLGLDLSPFLAVEEPKGGLRRSLGLTPSDPLVGIVGRLVPIKDHATILEAMVRIPGANLVIIGDGELRGDLEGQVEVMGLRGRVHFTGWLSDMAAAISDLDVVVLTSRNEGTPVALIEASAAAKAVVATDVGGVRSVVVDGLTGLLAPASDGEAVSALIARLLADADVRCRLGRAGREHVRERFGGAALLREIGALYADLLSAPPRGGTHRIALSPSLGTKA